MSVSCCTIAWYVHGTYMVQTYLYTFMPGGQDSRCQAGNLGRFKTQFAVICHWCNFENSLQSIHCEMRSGMQRAGRLPTTLQVQKVQNIQKFQDSWRVLLVEGLLEVSKVFFSSDSSRKWQPQWLVGENLDRRWWGALLC